MGKPAYQKGGKKGKVGKHVDNNASGGKAKGSQEQVDDDEQPSQQNSAQGKSKQFNNKGGGKSHKGSQGPYSRPGGSPPAVAPLAPPLKKGKKGEEWAANEAHGSWNEWNEWNDWHEDPNSGNADDSTAQDSRGKGNHKGQVGAQEQDNTGQQMAQKGAMGKGKGGSKGKKGQLQPLAPNSANDSFQQKGGPGQQPKGSSKGVNKGMPQGPGPAGPLLKGQGQAPPPQVQLPPMQQGQMQQNQKNQLMQMQQMQQTQGLPGGALVPMNQPFNQQIAIQQGPGGVGGNHQMVALMQQNLAKQQILHAPKKPFTFVRPKQHILLFGEMPSLLPPIKLQEVLEACGPLLGFRQATGTHFAFVHYATIDAIMKATVCFAGKRWPLCHLPCVIIPDVDTTDALAKWKKEQRDFFLATINSNLTEAETDWELEKTTIMTQAAVDEKLKQLQDWVSRGHSTNPVLNEAEKKRIQREEAIRSRREAEMQAEMFPLQRQEKKRRLEEMKKDDEDRILEAKENAMTWEERANFQKMQASKAIKDPSKWKRVLREVAQEMTRDEIFETKLYKDVDQEEFRESKVLEQKARKWLYKTLGEWMGGSQTEMAENVLRRIKAQTHPQKLIKELALYIDENDATIMVDRLWRMLVFELKRQGILRCDEEKVEENEAAA